jgi:hypothetical protein
MGLDFSKGGQPPPPQYYGEQAKTTTPAEWMSTGGATPPAKRSLPGMPSLPGAPAPDPGSGNAYAPPSAPSEPAAPTEGVLSGPGYQEDWYKKYGQDLMGGQSASEQLYAQGAAGSNPFYDYAQQQTIKAINDQAAARGNFNSSFTMNRIGNSIADLRGQQAHELGQLAGQSDRARSDRYSLSSGFAGDAQDRTERRVRGGVDAYTDLADKRADTVGNFYGQAGKDMTTAEMAAIELQLKKAGLSAAEIENLVKAGGEVAGIVAKAVS